VAEALASHGIVPGPADTPESLRERLNERYLEEVRALKQRQRRGEIPLSQYGEHVQSLKARYPVLGLALPHWAE
jgi:hypothetical protein